MATTHVRFLPVLLATAFGLGLLAAAAGYVTG